MNAAMWDGTRLWRAPTFAWGNRIANTPPGTPYPGYFQSGGTLDLSASLTKTFGPTHAEGRLLLSVRAAQPERRERQLERHAQLRAGHGRHQSVRHLVRICERGDRQLQLVLADLEVHGRQVHLPPERLLRAGQLEGQQHADARLRRAVRQSAAVPRCKRQQAELPRGPMAASARPALYKAGCANGV